MAGITINLAGNFGKFDELKDKAHKTAGSIKAAFGSNMGKAMFAGLSVASAAAFAGIVASVKKAIDAGGELQDMMAKTGASGKGLLVLQKAFENAGLAASDVAPALNRMQKALAGINEDGQPTNEAFAKLGLSVGSLMAMDPGAAFMKIGEALAGIQNPAQRAAVAMELFGKSGGNLLAVFTDAGAFEQAATQLGGLADLLPGMAGDADAVGDAFGSIDTKVQQLGAGIAAELMPNLLNVAKWINETDFTEAGTRIGMIGVKVAKVAELMGKVAKLSPAYQLGKAVEWVAFDGGNMTEKEKADTAAKSKAESDKLYQESRANAKPASVTAAEVFNPFAADREKMRKDSEGKAAKEAERTAKAAEAKAEADRKAAVETEKSRAAAAEECGLEKDMLAARIRGDAERLAKLEREKAIREEIKRLESAGFTAAEARKPAEDKVDAAKKASDIESSRQAAIDEKQRVQEVLAGKVNQSREKLDDLQYQSSVGSISSMQRVGGGGGAVGSGLDYQRQVADLQREANAYLRELIDVSRRDVEI
jgi:hypothetical protein